MAEGFGSHNKTSFPYDHWSVSNSLFCLSLSSTPLLFPFFPPSLACSWPFSPVPEAWHRFPANFPPSVSLLSRAQCYKAVASSLGSSVQEARCSCSEGTREP